MTFLSTARRATLALVALLFGFAAIAAHAADVTFVMENDHEFAVEVELYSQDRAHIWPGDNKVFLLDDGEAKTIPLACEEGESICYGAWVSGDQATYWGTGPGNQDVCEDCCYTCEGGMTETIVLTE